MDSSHAGWLELKSERVQQELHRLSDWQAEQGALEGRFTFADGHQAFAFLQQLAALLEEPARPPQRLALSGGALVVTLGEPGEVLERVHAEDLALAARVSALRAETEAR